MDQKNTDAAITEIETTEDPQTANLLARLSGFTTTQKTRILRKLTKKKEQIARNKKAEEAEKKRLRTLNEKHGPLFKETKIQESAISQNLGHFISPSRPTTFAGHA